MPDLHAMLDAHVRFELNCWTGENLSLTLADEVAALFKWLESVPLDEVVTQELVDDWVQRYVCQAPVTDEVADLVETTVRAAHAAALRDDTQVSELLPRELYDQVAGTVIGMKGVRHAITDQVTTSEVYSRLISHVLYHGIKNYLLTESLIARKVPGASSLMRLGQSALNTAAPNLEKSIDRQLTAFVNANIQDSIRESRNYLNSVLDEELLLEVTGEVWNSNADATVADAAGLVSVESLDSLAESGRAAWLHLRATPTFQNLISDVVAALLARHGKRPIAGLLNDVGITSEQVSEQLTMGVTPVLAKAVEDGYLEERIRGRLGEFYSTYGSAQVSAKRGTSR